MLGTDHKNVISKTKHQEKKVTPLPQPSKDRGSSRRAMLVPWMGICQLAIPCISRSREGCWLLILNSHTHAAPQVNQASSKATCNLTNRTPGTGISNATCEATACSFGQQCNKQGSARIEVTFPSFVLQIYFPHREGSST